MELIIALRMKIHGEDTPILFTTDVEALNYFYNPINNFDNRGYLNIKKGDIVKYPNSRGEYLSYEVKYLNIQYNPNLNVDMFKYGIVAGQIGNLEPYNLCIDLTLEPLL